MRKLIFLLITVVAGCATEPAKTPEPKPVAQLKNPFFWTATKNGVSSYFLGTMHVKVSAEELPVEIYQKLFLSHALVTEIGPLDEAAQAVKEHRDEKKVFDKLLVPNGSLKKQLSDKAWQNLRVLTKNRFRDETMNSWSPYLAFDYLAAGQSALPAGIREIEMQVVSPMDLMLQDYATKRNIPIYGLDDIRETLKMLDASMNAKALQERLVDPGLFHPKEEMKELAKAYREGSESAIVEFLNREAELNKTVIEKRNELWLQKVLKHHNDHYPAFFAVGAGHLVGEHSLLKMLEKQGFKVERWTH
jgi:uncharacterized protein YbaP (TraB family)